MAEESQKHPSAVKASEPYSQADYWPLHVPERWLSSHSQKEVPLSFGADEQLVVNPGWDFGGG